MSRAEAYVRAALEGIRSELEQAPAGGRNRSCFVAGASAGRFVPGGFLDETEIIAKLTQAAPIAGDFTQKEAEQAIRNGIEAGRSSPWADGELEDRPEAPSKSWPSRRKLQRFFSRCEPVTYPSALPVAAWLEGRGLPAGDVAAFGLARAVPPWVSEQWPGPWRSHRCVVPAFSPAGEFRAVRFRSVEPGRDPKASWTIGPKPEGVTFAGLVFATTAAISFLRGELEAEHVIIAEGETDFLALALDGIRQRAPVLGIVQGSEGAFRNMNWPKETAAHIVTDNDASGEKYAAVIRTALEGKGAKVYRRLP